MIHRDPVAFLAHARSLGIEQPGCPRAAFLITPEGFRLAADSASDNLYMDLSNMVDPLRALQQHAALQRALARRIPTIAFPGDELTPEAVFPNNVFATARVLGEVGGRFIIGRMRHPLRKREAARDDIRRFFVDVLGYQALDLRALPGLSELTGTMVIDRARGLGFAGLSPRCDDAGIRAMYSAFGLRAVLAFELVPGEYHTNVVMSALAGRGLVLAPSAFCDPAVPEALLQLYGDAAIVLDAAELSGYAGNCIALDHDRVWMSERAADALTPATRGGFARRGWHIASVPLDEIEKAGGSLRCCVAEIY